MKGVYFAIFVILSFLLLGTYHTSKTGRWLWVLQTSDSTSTISFREARRLSPEELLSRPLSLDHTVIPKLFHQSWMDTALPAKFHEWSSSCRNAHPDWEWVLWTDENNLALVETFAPWFLSTYKGLKSEIYRADAVRNVYMHVFGG